MCGSVCGMLDAPAAVLLDIDVAMGKFWQTHDRLCREHGSSSLISIGESRVHRGRAKELRALVAGQALSAVCPSGLRVSKVTV